MGGGEITHQDDDTERKQQRDWSLPREEILGFEKETEIFHKTLLKIITLATPSGLLLRMVATS